MPMCVNLQVVDACFPMRACLSWCVTLQYSVYCVRLRSLFLPFYILCFILHLLYHVQHQTECHDPLAAVRKERGEKIVSLSLFLPKINTYATFISIVRLPPCCVPAPFPYAQNSASSSNSGSFLSKRIFFCRHQQRRRWSSKEMG